MSFKREYVAIFPNDVVRMSGKQHNTRQKATETELFACEEKTGERPEERDFQDNQTICLLKNRSTCSLFLWTSKRLRAPSKRVMSCHLWKSTADRSLWPCKTAPGFSVLAVITSLCLSRATQKRIRPVSGKEKTGMKMATVQLPADYRQICLSSHDNIIWCCALIFSSRCCL